MHYHSESADVRNFTWIRLPNNSFIRLIYQFALLFVNSKRKKSGKKPIQQANKLWYTYGFKNIAIMDLKPVFSRTTLIIFLGRKATILQVTQVKFLSSVGFEGCDLLSHADFQVSAEIAKQGENKKSSSCSKAYISSVPSIPSFSLSVDIQTAQLNF